MSKKLDQSLLDAYSSIYEAKRGHAAGDSDVEKQASQLASDVRYKAKGKVKPGASEEEKKKVFLQILQASPAPNAVKSMAKQKLLGEENISEEGYDRMRDDRLVKYGIGHDGSDRKSTPSKRTPDNKKIKGKTVLQKETEKKYGKGKSALDIVKAKITAKHGKGAIMDEFKPKQVVPKKQVTQNPKDMSKGPRDKAPVDYRVLAQSHEPVGNIFNEFKKMDPIGKEDSDVNNDGKKDKTDKYLLKRRKAITTAIAKKRGRVKEGFSAWRIDLDFNEQVKK